MQENIIQINGGITINIDMSVKNAMYVKKVIFRIILYVILKMENIYRILWVNQQLCVMKLLDGDTKAKSNNKAQSYNKTKAVPTSFNEENMTCKTQNIFVLLAFSLITIAAVSIYIYLTKYQEKQKHL